MSGRKPIASNSIDRRPWGRCRTAPPSPVSVGPHNAPSRPSRTFFSPAIHEPWPSSGRASTSAMHLSAARRAPRVAAVRRSQPPRCVDLLQGLAPVGSKRPITGTAATAPRRSRRPRPGPRRSPARPRRRAPGVGRPSWLGGAGCQAAGGAWRLAGNGVGVRARGRMDLDMKPGSPGAIPQLGAVPSVPT